MLLASFNGIAGEPPPDPASLADLLEVARAQMLAKRLPYRMGASLRDCNKYEPVPVRDDHAVLLLDVPS